MRLDALRALVRAQRTPVERLQAVARGHELVRAATRFVRNRFRVGAGCLPAQAEPDVRAVGHELEREDPIRGRGCFRAVEQSLRVADAPELDSRLRGGEQRGGTLECVHFAVGHQLPARERMLVAR